MKQKADKNIKKRTANFFGSFGYLICCLQWFWGIMLYFSVIQSATSLVVPDASDKHVEYFPSFTFTLPSFAQMIILALIVIVMIGVTTYVLIKIPMNMVKTSNKVVHRTAETMAPIVIKAQHKKDTKKLHIKITSELILAIKALLIIIPIVLTAASGLLEKQAIDYSIAIIVGCGLACFTIFFFAFQYLLGSFFRVKISDLW